MITDKSHIQRKQALSRGFDLYQMYLAINLHFNKEADYDFIKYNGKVRGSIDKFNKSPAKHRFCAIARRVNGDGYKAAVFSIQKAYNGFIPERAITPKNISYHLNRMSSDISVWSSQGFLDDVQALKDDMASSLDDVMKPSDDEAPLAVRKYLADEIDWKTLVNLYNNYDENMMRKYKDESFFPIIKMAIDSVNEHMYFIGPHNHNQKVIQKARFVDWAN